MWSLLIYICKWLILSDWYRPLFKRNKYIWNLWYENSKIDEIILFTLNPKVTRVPFLRIAKTSTLNPIKCKQYFSHFSRSNGIHLHFIIFYWSGTPLPESIIWKRMRSVNSGNNVHSLVWQRKKMLLSQTIWLFLFDYLYLLYDEMNEAIHRWKDFALLHWKGQKVISNVVIHSTLDKIRVWIWMIIPRGFLGMRALPLRSFYFVGKIMITY